MLPRHALALGWNAFCPWCCGSLPNLQGSLLREEVKISLDPFSSGDA